MTSYLTCKNCNKLVTLEPLHIDLCRRYGFCFLCIVSRLEEEIGNLRKKRDDLAFSFYILEYSYSQMQAAYEGAVKDNEQKYNELDALRKDLIKYQSMLNVNIRDLTK